MPRLASGDNEPVTVDPDALRRRLDAPLPGFEAQLRMAPRPRPVWPPDGPPLRDAAALLLLYPADGEWWLPLTVRASTLPQHTGQVSLPGGRLDPGETVEQAALRDAYEEVGLTAASFLSFPVAAFLSLGVLSLAFMSGPLATAVSEGTLGGYNAEKGPQGRLPIDTVAIPVFRATLGLVNLAKDFSPIDSLSTGRSITWGQLGRAFGQIILLLGGILGLFGVFVFNRRELATAQGTQ